MSSTNRYCNHSQDEDINHKRQHAASSQDTQHTVQHTTAPQTMLSDHSCTTAVTDKYLKLTNCTICQMWKVPCAICPSFHTTGTAYWLQWKLNVWYGHNVHVCHIHAYKDHLLKHNHSNKETEQHYTELWGAALAFSPSLQMCVKQGDPELNDVEKGVSTSTCPCIYASDNGHSFS